METPPHAQPYLPKPRVSEDMEALQPPGEEEDPSSALWDFGDLLDFTVDEHFSISLDPDHPSPTHPIANEHLEFPGETSPVAGSNRIRKRDPRMSCSNFLAGRVPCACPELDEKMEAEEGVPGKKRARTTARTTNRTPRGASRCQVPGCEADITELKGYHRRHRVCLRCAHASAVVLDGETKRYCQQCGKFHVISDFDEGKRSCRRKLERHNNRRRRKPGDSRVLAHNEPQGVVQIEDVPYNGEAGRDGLRMNSPITETETGLESEDGQATTLSSARGSQNIVSDTVASFAVSGETQLDGGKDNSKDSPSPVFYDNKGAYSSMCPTGRISFKLYDWNPAEFPRRLRHQIFQWLANMPVELEGYIRPGCTILTVFITMPKFMWVKIHEDPISYLNDFVVAPGRVLSGKGNILVFVNDMIFRVMKGGTSVMKVKVKVQAPRLHYVHPLCFEAGKPLEFVACGGNLLQSKFRFLVSFAGKYLVHDSCAASQHGQTEENAASSCNHQLYKIRVPQTESDLFGPAFVEVENESGLSNFIPILIGDKEICAEMEILQQRFDVSLFLKGSEMAAIGPPHSCEVSAVRQTAFSEFLLDVAWLLKEPVSENFQESITVSQIQRFNSLLNFLICNDSTTILEKLLDNLKLVLNDMKYNNRDNGTCAADLSLLQKHIDIARDILDTKYKRSKGSVLQSGSLSRGVSFSESCSQDNVLPIPVNGQDKGIITNAKVEVVTSSTSGDRSETVPLLRSEVIMNVKHEKEWPRRSCGGNVSMVVFGSRTSIFLISIAAVCLGMCAVLLHPHEVREFAVSIRRCLFDRT